jgi:flagellar biosynthesis protein FliR
MNFQIPIWNFFLVFGRTSALVAFLPVLSDAQVPRRLRLGIAVWISLALMPIVPISGFNPTNLLDIVIALTMEAILGFLFAFTLRLVFAGIFLGSQWVDTEVGFQAAQQLNPISGVPNSPFGTLMLATSSLLFWVLGYFEEMLAFWARIFQLIPAPILSFSPRTGETLISLSSMIFLKALELVTPMLAIMFIVTLTIGLMSRAVQGVNIFVESYNIKLMVGILALVLNAPLMLTLVQKQLNGFPEAWTALVRSLTTP